jgi:hypothetical protein
MQLMAKELTDELTQRDATGAKLHSQLTQQQTGALLCRVRTSFYVTRELTTETIALTENMTGEIARLQKQLDETQAKYETELSELQQELHSLQVRHMLCELILLLSVHSKQHRTWTTKP